MNKAQRQSCKRLWDAHTFNRGDISYSDTPMNSETYLAFRRRFRLCQIGSDPGYFFGAVPSGMWIGIEIDGHAHS